MSESSMDVTGLSMEQGSDSVGSYRPKRSKASLLIGLLVMALVGLSLYLGKDRFMPRPEVAVVRVMAVKSSETSLPEGTLAFQSAGWVEPAPFPKKVLSLVSGVVDTMTVIEGEAVKEGKLIATLVDTDLLLDMQGVEVEKERAELAVKVLEKELETAQANIRHHDARIATAKQRLEKLTTLADIYDKAQTSLPKTTRIKARQDALIQKSTVEELKSERAVWVAAEAEKKAALAAQSAELKAVSVTFARAWLALERTKIYAPSDGIIYRLVARSGSRINLNSDSSDAATVAELFDPTQLQVRVDVPLADAGNLAIGQKAKVKVEILPDKEFDGVVTSIVGRADVIRNTLQAKVKIIKPDGVLRPEMLAKVKFLSVGPASSSGEPTTTERVRLYVPNTAIGSDGTVWVVDRVSGKLKQAPVTKGRGIRGDWVEVASGVNAGQQIVANRTAELKEGLHVIPVPIEKEANQ